MPSFAVPLRSKRQTRGIFSAFVLTIRCARISCLLSPVVSVRPLSLRSNADSRTDLATSASCFASALLLASCRRSCPFVRYRFAQMRTHGPTRLLCLLAACLVDFTLASLGSNVNTLQKHCGEPRDIAYLVACLLE